MKTVATTIRITTIRAIALVCLLILSAPIAVAKSKAPATLEVALAPVSTGSPLATGKAVYADRGKQKLFTVEVHNLPVGTFYLTVGGAKVGDIAVTSDGVETHGITEFAAKKLAGTQKLFFDPRGKQIEIRDVFGTLMGGTLPSNAPGAKPVYSNYADNVVGEATQTSGKKPRGSLKIRSQKTYAWMHFELQRLAQDPHTLLANDVEIAAFSPGPGGFAKLEFETDPSDTDYPLNFDPAGVTYRVMHRDIEVLRFTTDPGTIGGGLGSVRLTTAQLANAGKQPFAEGDAALTAKGANLDMSVHIGSLMPGPYSLRIAGSSQGTIHISIGSDPLSFFDLSNYRSGIGILPLTVDPRGRLVEILDGTNTVVLTRTFPN